MCYEKPKYCGFLGRDTEIHCRVQQHGRQTAQGSERKRLWVGTPKSFAHSADLKVRMGECEAAPQHCLERVCH